MRIAGGHPRSRGQAIAEFALVFPVFMLLVGGIVQLGVIFWGQNTLNQIVRDSGRYAVTEPDCTAGSKTDATNKAMSIASNSSFVGSVASLTVNVTFQPPSPDPPSDSCPATSNTQHVWVRVTVAGQVPVFFPVIPGNGQLSSTALFRMEPTVTP